MESTGAVEDSVPSVEMSFLDVERDLLVAYCGIFTLAMVPIYIGAHLSLKQKEV